MLAKKKDLHRQAGMQAGTTHDDEFTLLMNLAEEVNKLFAQV